MTIENPITLSDDQIRHALMKNTCDECGEMEYIEPLYDRDLCFECAHCSDMVPTITV